MKNDQRSIALSMWDLNKYIK